MQPIWQSLFSGLINRGAQEGIVRLLDWLREVPDEEIREATYGMRPDTVATLWRVVRAARGDEVKAEVVLDAR